MLIPSPAGSRTYGRGTAVAFGFLVAVASFAALFPWLPAGPSPGEGDTVRRTVIAPFDRTYISAVRTEEARDQAAAAEAEVLVFDWRTVATQLAELDRLLADLDAVRENPALSTSARESAMRAVAGEWLSRTAAGALTAADDERWATLTAEARSALELALAEELLEQDVPQARERLADLLSPALPSQQALAVRELVAPLLAPTLVVDEETTAERRLAARLARAPVEVTVARGDVVAGEGETLDAAGVEQLAALGLRGRRPDASRVAATAAVAALMGAAAGGYLFVVRPPALGGVRRLTLFALLLAAPTLAARLALPPLLLDPDWSAAAYALPLAAAPIAAAVLLDAGAATLLVLMLTLVSAFVAAYVSAPGGAGFAAEVAPARVAMAVAAGSLAGVYVAARADRVQRYLVAGAGSAGAAGAALLIFWLLDAVRSAGDLLLMGGAVAVGGLLSALIAVGAFMLLSRPFGIITRVELMELAQLNHRLLRRLQDEAPGTFQHSILVGNLAERAADRIGANALLTRVGAYYHDVGKLVAPEFFIENFDDEENPHDALDPLQSTRVIHQHVTGGMEIARREGLPEAVVQFIPQHHGTTLMAFFYRRAAAIDEDIDPELFRYPGPKPQTREAAVVMLADAAEATVRASGDRSAEAIRETVDATIRERIEQGQFGECEISLRDLGVVAESYAGALTAVYHPRVEYPEPTDRELVERGTPPPEQPQLPEGAAAPETPASAARAAGASTAPEPPGRPQPLSEDDS